MSNLKHCFLSFEKMLLTPFNVFASCEFCFGISDSILLKYCYNITPGLTMFPILLQQVVKLLDKPGDLTEPSLI